MFRDRVWKVLAVLLIASISGWSLLSRYFVYGEGHLERPILLFLGAYLASWVVYLVAVTLLRRNKWHLSMLMIVGVALTSRLVLLPSNLIQENDVYRYVLDGQVLLHGENPYLYSPQEVPRLGIEELREELSGPDARLVLSRIGYPEIPTVYPPVAEASFALGALIGNWDWRGQRGVFVCFDLLTLLLLLFLLGRLHLPHGLLLLYAWNPLLLKEITNSAHVDILVGFFLVLGLVGFAGFETSRRYGWLLLAAGSIGLAAASKLYPLVLLPAVAVWLCRRERLATSFAFGATAVGVLVFCYAPFLSIGWSDLTAGLHTYASTWRMNEGAFLLFNILGSSPRLISAGVLALLSVVLPLLRRDRSVIDLAETFSWILLCWFLLIPTPFPWYATPLVALLVISGERPVALPVLLMTGLVGLYYLSFYFEYHAFPAVWWTVTRVVEHTLIWVALGIAVFANRFWRPCSDACTEP